MAKLSALKVKRLVEPGRYGDGDGLWLQVRDAERRSWLLRYTLHGKAREMGLGAEANVSLAQARELARDARRRLQQGVDPLDQRQAAQLEAKAVATTFRDVAASYIKAHEGSWKNAKHRAQWQSTLDAYAFPTLGDLAVNKVDTAGVMKVLDPVWREKPETASRLRGRIEAVLDYATARGWRKGDNPARWRGHVANLLPPRSKVKRVEHHAALPWHEMGAFVAKLRGQAGTGALALEFTILTAARTGEVIGATWPEIDLTGKVWTIPAERMKAGAEHRVPLSEPALAVLARMAPGAAKDGFVFPGGKRHRRGSLASSHGLSNMAMTATLRRMDRGDLTVHGFRSTFRDWASELTAYPREVAEAALAHTVRDKVEAAYRRGDLFAKRARLMTEWATFCAQPASAAEVIVLREAR